MHSAVRFKHNYKLFTHKAVIALILYKCDKNQWPVVDKYK